MVRILSGAYRCVDHGYGRTSGFWCAICRWRSRAIMSIRGLRIMPLIKVYSRCGVSIVDAHNCTYRLTSLFESVSLTWRGRRSSCHGLMAEGVEFVLISARLREVRVVRVYSSQSVSFRNIIGVLISWESQDTHFDLCLASASLEGLPCHLLKKSTDRSVIASTPIV